MTNQDKELIVGFSTKISSALKDLANEDSENYLGGKIPDENLPHFFYALSIVAPCNILQNMTGLNKNYLEFSHFSNQLCFDFCEKES